MKQVRVIYEMNKFDELEVKLQTRGNGSRWETVDEAPVAGFSYTDANSVWLAPLDILDGLVDKALAGYTIVADDYKEE